MTIQMSASLPTFAAHDPGGWGHLFDAAKRFDEAGVDRVVMSDHVVFGEELESYGRPELGGQKGGRQPTGPDGHWLEPVTTLAVLAGMTTRVRLGTNILLAALRRPVVLAKSAATLDVLSLGRLDLGVGVGWQRAEYDAAGLDFDRRGRLLDVTLEVCQALWRDATVAVSLPELEFSATHMMPKPLQPGGVPIWVSGTVNTASVRRLARFGRGWIPWGADARDLAESIPRMKDAMAAAGSDPTGLQVVGNLRAHRSAGDAIDLVETMAEVRRLVAAGVTDVRAPLRGDDLGTDRLPAFVAAFRDTTASS